MAARNVNEAAAQLFKTGKYADLAVRCGDYNAKAHKSIVCSQSEWFAKAVDDGRFVEGQNGVIEFKGGEEPDAVKAMLQFLYTGDFRVPPTERSERHILLHYLDVYAVADLIQHDGLKDAIVAPFKAYADGQWVEPAFSDVIRKTYDVTPPGVAGIPLRKVLVDITARNLQAIYERHADFWRTVEQTPAFGADVTLALSQNSSPIDMRHTREYICGSCEVTAFAEDHGSDEKVSCPNGCLAIDDNDTTSATNERAEMDDDNRFGLFTCRNKHTFGSFEYEMKQCLFCNEPAIFVPRP